MTFPSPGRSWRRKWATRVAVGAVALVGLLMAVGYVYQTASERRDLQEHPAPGRLVDVGGHSLHLHCIGSGQPTVVLEAGLGNDTNHWALVQSEAAGVTRVCSYDRAGLGWSDPGPLPRTATRVVDELAILLQRADEPGPFILVGHSNGGPYARLFAAAYPERVAGVVLVDPNPGLADGCERLPAASRAMYGTLVSFTAVGVPRLLMDVLFPLTASPLPPAERQNHSALRVRTGAVRALWSERQNTCAMLQAARDADHPVAIPIIVLSAQRRPPNAGHVTALQREMADELDALEFEVVEGSGHWIHLDRPDAVVEAVQRLVSLTRA